ncbi:MAG: hypothetical protein M1136_10630 [Chloroflexi bacterium]|nr:hypothetical protein [Chloroflexota bacterium]MCL5076081.1 hypothetical protein [Chloroflexota bacterium]
MRLVKLFVVIITVLVASIPSSHAQVFPQPDARIEQAQVRPEADARIEIVWPHDLAGNPVPLTQADRANVRVYLFERGIRDAYCFTSDIGLYLMMATNNDVPSPLHVQGIVGPRRVTQGNISFFAWDFNDVDVSLARNPENRLYFIVSEFGLLPGPKVGATLYVQSNVWAHGANALTFFPLQDTPIGTAPAPPPGPLPRIDPKIQIVWPHDRQGKEVPVTQADLVNIGVTIFHHGTLISVSPEDARSVQLYQALNQEPLRPVALGQKRIVMARGITYPVWEFNNIDVSAARDPRNKYFFQVTDGSDRSNIWVHGADGRTYFPIQDVPDTGCP